MSLRIVSKIIVFLTLVWSPLEQKWYYFWYHCQTLRHDRYHSRKTILNSLISNDNLFYKLLKIVCWENYFQNQFVSKISYPDYRQTKDLISRCFKDQITIEFKVPLQLIFIIYKEDNVNSNWEHFYYKYWEFLDCDVIYLRL